MTPLATLGTYAAGLALAFGAAAGVGGLVGPVGTAAGDGTTGMQDMTGAADHGGDGEQAGGGAGLPAGGLAVSQDGYTLQLARTDLPAGSPAALRFTVAGPDGQRLTDFELVHDKELHLVLARSDLSGYQHLHPTRDAEGRWEVPLTLAPGSYKVIADLTPAGRETPLALAADLLVPGPVTATPLPPVSRTATVDGYVVTMTGDLTAGRVSDLVFSVSRDGRPVTDLEPYLGAYGHLVALRVGDGAYLHVHPEGDQTPGPEVQFGADVPDAATHRLFLDFQHDGVVRTAAFTTEARR